MDRTDANDLRSTVTHLRTLPLADRTLPAAKQAAKLVRALSALLPADEAAIVRRQLESITIREVTIHAIREEDGV